MALPPDHHRHRRLAQLHPQAGVLLCLPASIVRRWEHSRTPPATSLSLALLRSAYQSTSTDVSPFTSHNTPVVCFSQVPNFLTVHNVDLSKDDLHPVLLQWFINQLPPVPEIDPMPRCWMVFHGSRPHMVGHMMGVHYRTYDFLSVVSNDTDIHRFMDVACAAIEDHSPYGLTGAMLRTMAEDLSVLIPPHVHQIVTDWKLRNADRCAKEAEKEARVAEREAKKAAKESEEYKDKKRAEEQH